MSMTADLKRRARKAYDPRFAIGRVLVATLAGVGAGIAVPSRFGVAMQVTLGWDAGACLLLVLLWLVVMTSDASETRCRAAGADPGRTAVWVLVLAASGFSLFAAAVLLRHHDPIAAGHGALTSVSAVIAVITAWGLTHTGFTLRYAHLYYRDDDEGEGGLIFPGTQSPDDYDFSYFAFTIGMCFQVSDVAVASSQIRRAVLAHALISFTYNTVILALALNLLFGHVG
jgi:uncharacterized membrane protein